MASTSKGDLAARQTELEEHLATIARKKKAKSKGQLLDSLQELHQLN